MEHFRSYEDLPKSYTRSLNDHYGEGAASGSSQDGVRKITDYFSSSLLADVDFDAWDEDDSFCAGGFDDDDDDSGSSNAKRLKTGDDNENN